MQFLATKVGTTMVSSFSKYKTNSQPQLQSASDQDSIGSFSPYIIAGTNYKKEQTLMTPKFAYA